MAKTQAMIGFNGGGALYSQTPKSCLEDIGVNKGVNEVPEPSYSSEARVSSLLEKEPEINQKLDSRTQGFENDEVCHSERSEGLQSLANIVCKKILNYPTSTLPCNARPSQTRGAEVQDDISCYPRPLWERVRVRGTQPAFTLAEVLITLGVVGIIAAMTLPMLAENYQRRIVETRLKRFYTTFNQAILRSIDVNGPYDGWGYFVNEKLDVNAQTVSQSELIANVFDLYLRPYLNIAQTQKVFYTNSTWTNLYYFSDGSAFLYNSTKHNRDILYFPKDPVRCLKLKDVDRHGICSFNFIFSNKNIQDYKYLVNKGLEPFKWAWDGRLESLYHDAVYFHGCDIGELGVRCSAIIQYNNWEIPADYPRKIRY